MLELHSPIILTTIQVIELAGVAIIAGGAAVTSVLFLARIARSGTDRLDAFNRFRSGFGRAILLGLEFLVAADIINTITVEMTLESVSSLAVIVLVRTLLSFSLEVEIEGRWPWGRGPRHDEGRPDRKPPPSR